MKYKNWLAEWLENIVKPSAKIRTYERYREIAAKHLIPSIGEYDVNHLTPVILQELISELLQHGNLNNGKGLSASTVHTVITIIQTSLKSAYSFGELNHYTAKCIKRPRLLEKEVPSFSKQEQKQIEQAILSKRKDRLFGIVLCLYTGLRIGELIALEWKDINFETGLMKISKTCHYGKSATGAFGRQIGTPKTHTSRREIPIPKQILEHLKKIRRRSESIYVIANGPKPISIRSYQRSFASLLKNLGIAHKGFHSLRHTFATRALECGMDVKTLSEILGHKDATVTLNRYVHSLLEHKQEMMNRVGKLLMI